MDGQDMESIGAVYVVVGTMKHESYAGYAGYAGYASFVPCKRGHAAESQNMTTY